MNDWISKLKAGDDVVTHVWGMGRSLAKVEKATDSTVWVAGHQYRRNDGGNGRGTPIRIMEATESNVLSAKRETAIRQLAAPLPMAIHRDVMDTETLVQAAALVAQAREMLTRKDADLRVRQMPEVR